MPSERFQTVDQYIGSFPEDVQRNLEAIRRVIREAEPEAEEVISYQMPAYRYQGMLIFFGAFKNHYAISVPPPNAVFEVFREELSPYKVSKSTIQVPAGRPLPLDLVSDIVRLRAKENLAKAKLKRKSPVQKGAPA